MIGLLIMMVGAVCMMFGGLALMVQAHGVVMRFLVLGVVLTLFGATTVSDGRLLLNPPDRVSKP